MRHACLLLLLTIGVAQAAPPSAAERGKKLWRAAVSDHERGDLDGAIAKYEEAYKLYPEGNILYNLGQAYRQKLDYEHAAASLREYLKKKLSAPNRAEVERQLAELDTLVAAQKLARAPAPPPAPPPVAQPPPVPPPEPPPPDDQHRRWYQDVVGLSLVAGGVVAAGVGTGFLVHAASVSDEAGGTVDQGMARDLQDSARSNQTVGAVVTGVGGALIVAGVVKLVLTGSRRPARVAVGAAPTWFFVAGTF